MSYDYDYETEPNFPEAEEIINKATGEFADFLRGAFADEYKNIQVAKENNQSMEKRLDERLRSIYEKERELKTREAELLKSEEAQYDKLKAKWFKELGLAFDIGGTVYYCKDITKHITCPTCNGAKKVKARIESAENTPSEFEINCPTCSGCGNIKGEKEFEIVEATVTEINAHLRKSQTGAVTIIDYSSSSYELITYVWVKDKNSSNERGINGKKLYKTKEEAEASLKELEEGK